MFALSFIPARTAWYENMGHRVWAANEERVVADGRFTSERFSEAHLRTVLGPCDLHSIGDVITPSALRVFEIGSGYVLGVNRDALDIEPVQMFGVRPSS